MQQRFRGRIADKGLAPGAVLGDGRVAAAQEPIRLTCSLVRCVSNLRWCFSWSFSVRRMWRKSSRCTYSRRTVSASRRTSAGAPPPPPLPPPPPDDVEAIPETRSSTKQAGATAEHATAGLWLPPLPFQDIIKRRGKRDGTISRHFRCRQPVADNTEQHHARESCSASVSAAPQRGTFFIVLLLFYGKVY